MYGATFESAKQLISLVGRTHLAGFQSLVMVEFKKFSYLTISQQKKCLLCAVMRVDSNPIKAAAQFKLI